MSFCPVTLGVYGAKMCRPTAGVGVAFRTFSGFIFWHMYAHFRSLQYLAQSIGRCTMLPVPATSSKLCAVAGKCFLPKSMGTCRASMTRYFYNASALECQRFIYGGCDGNANNFESMKLCEVECERPLSPGESPDTLCCTFRQNHCKPLVFTDYFHCIVRFEFVISV